MDTVIVGLVCKVDQKKRGLQAPSRRLRQISKLLLDDISQPFGGVKLIGRRFLMPRGKVDVVVVSVQGLHVAKSVEEVRKRFGSSMPIVAVVDQLGIPAHPYVVECGATALVTDLEQLNRFTWSALAQTRSRERYLIGTQTPVLFRTGKKLQPLFDVLFRNIGKKVSRDDLSKTEGAGGLATLRKRISDLQDVCEGYYTIRSVRGGGFIMKSLAEKKV